MENGIREARASIRNADARLASTINNHSAVAHRTRARRLLSQYPLARNLFSPDGVGNRRNVQFNEDVDGSYKMATSDISAKDMDVMVSHMFPDEYIAYSCGSRFLAPADRDTQEWMPIANKEIGYKRFILLTCVINDNVFYCMDFEMLP